MIVEVNGVERTVEAAPETPLLYVLRNDLGLAGTRFGCGSGQCGACFVLVDGRAMASCDLPVSFVAGKKSPPSRAWAGSIRCRRRSSGTRPRSAATA